MDRVALPDGGTCENSCIPAMELEKHFSEKREEMGGMDRVCHMRSRLLRDPTSLSYKVSPVVQSDKGPRGGPLATTGKSLRWVDM